MRVHHLHIQAARDVVKFAATAPATERGRVAIINIDDARPDALNVLLKPLEESGSHMHFLLICSQRPPRTILSRATLFTFGLLTEQEIAQILVQERGIARAVAERVAASASGQVKRALSILVSIDDKAVVLSALHAIEAGDAEALDSLADRWREEHTTLLVDACTEGVSRQWKVFAPNEIGSLPRSVLLRIMMSVRNEVRPRLVVRSSLMDVLLRESSA
jgi:hypothetical protein